MKKQHYLPKDENGQLAWLNNFVTKFSATYYTVLGFVLADATSASADLAFMTYLINFKNQMKTKTSDWVAYCSLAAYGQTGIPALGAVPGVPSAGSPPTVVLPNIYGRMAAIVRRIKEHPAYTPAIGQDLGIIGADDPINPNTMKPVLTLELQAGHPSVKWVKSGMQGVDLYVDRGAGTFVFLARDTVPDYLDTFALPAAGQSAVWNYKAIYVQNDIPCGQWSDVACLSVMG